MCLLLIISLQLWCAHSSLTHPKLDAIGELTIAIQKRQLLSRKLNDKIAEPNKFFVSLRIAHQPTIRVYERLVQFIRSMRSFLAFDNSRK